eukprot:TRINITY_DN11102_c0_g1_i12.p3 TRINITY_DN11102_c0_g1~~TRINITY_DN11102_c0_g1_i12.p3  ORF type:complete len:113 (-),score=4.09 TRINITY_DN11102_c0_g1_i12:595-933(-)
MMQEVSLNLKGRHTMQVYSFTCHNIGEQSRVIVCTAASKWESSRSLKVKQLSARGRARANRRAAKNSQSTPQTPRVRHAVQLMLGGRGSHGDGSGFSAVGDNGRTLFNDDGG